MRTRGLLFAAHREQGDRARILIAFPVLGLIRGWRDGLTKQWRKYSWVLASLCFLLAGMTAAEDGWTAYKLGKLKAEQGDREGAVEAFRQAAFADPLSKTGKSAVAETVLLLLSEAGTESVVSFLDDVLAQINDPKDKVSFLWHVTMDIEGVCFFCRGETNSRKLRNGVAKEMLIRLIDQDPMLFSDEGEYGRLMAFCLLAEVCIAEKQYDQAVHWFSTGLNEEPVRGGRYFWAAKCALGEAYYLADDNDMAASTLQSVISDAASGEFAYVARLYLADMYYFLGGDKKEALARYAELLDGPLPAVEHQTAPKAIERLRDVVIRKRIAELEGTDRP